MSECTEQERELLDRLLQARVISPSGYESNKGELQIYRMRLFSFQERHDLRCAIDDATVAQGEPRYLTARGCAGMMDELEMVNFQAHGRPIEAIKRNI